MVLRYSVPQGGNILSKKMNGQLAERYVLVMVFCISASLMCVPEAILGPTSLQNITGKLEIP